MQWLTVYSWIGAYLGTDYSAKDVMQQVYFCQWESGRISLVTNAIKLVLRLHIYSKTAVYITLYWVNEY